MKIVCNNLFLLFFLLGLTAIFSQKNTQNYTVINSTKTLTMEQTLSSYLKFNSFSGREKEAGEWLKKVCSEKGLYITEMGTDNGNYNFSASLYPLTKELPNIIFLNHIDVVPAGDIAKWEYPPFSGEITDTDIWGRGAFDNKGNAVMQLFALLKIKEQSKNTQLPYNITFLAVSVEETQGDGGAKFVAENYLDLLNPAVLIGEGAPGMVGIVNPNSTKSLFGISVVHKRALWVELELSLKTFGHGSITPKKYATKEMNEALYRLLKKKQKVVYSDLNIEFLKQLGHIEKGLDGFVLKHPRLFKCLLVPQLRKQEELFALFSNTITLTNIKSEGDAINVIPSSVKAMLDCRLLPYESSELFLKNLKEKLHNNAIKVVVKKNMPDVIPSSKDSNYYKSIEKALLKEYPDSDIISTLLPNFNDVGIFRLFNVPGYAITPIVLEKEFLEHIHNENERIPIKNFRKGKDAYASIINEILVQEN